jgi:hypothetical protein
MPRRPEVACFRVFPEPGSWLFYRVRVFATEDTLRHYLAADRDVDRTAAFHSRALCTRWTRTRVLANGRTRTCPDMGELLFVLPLIDSEVISHECSHAAIGWAQRVGLRLLHDAPGVQYARADEERYCYALGRMVKDVTERVAAIIR